MVHRQAGGPDHHRGPAVTVLTEEQTANVANVLVRAGVDVQGQLSSALITGGRSNLTYRLDDGYQRWVLRMPPRHGRTPSAHDVAREFRVTAALRNTDVPVAAAVTLCEDESVLGAPFAVAAFVDGRAVQSRDDLDQVPEATLGHLVDRLVQTLAALHRVDHVAVGLERFGRPDGYAARQLMRWAGQWDLVGTPDLDPLAQEIITRLGDELPEQRRPAIVHGDFRIDNTLLTDLDGIPEVAAVVDWELSTIGDPVADVAMMCAYRDPAFDLVVGAPSAWTSPRLPDTTRLAGLYESAGGAELVDWGRHLALAHLKIAVIAAGIDHRFRAGSGSSPGFDSAGGAVGIFLQARGPRSTRGTRSDEVRAGDRGHPRHRQGHRRAARRAGFRPDRHRAGRRRT